MSQKFEVCVIGAGPGGYVAAIRAAQLGFKTAIIEREYLGGVCLNVGCIPSKAMISAAHFLHKAQHQASDMGIEITGPIKVNMLKLKNWKQSVSDKMSAGVAQLLKANDVEVLRGEAEFKTVNELLIKSDKNQKVVHADYFIIATGSRPIEIPGFTVDEKNVLTSTGALDLTEIPKKIVTIGGGYIGLEISSYLRKLGSEVVILEAGDELLKGVIDPDCVKVVERTLKKSGAVIHTSARALSYEKKNGQLIVKATIQGKEQFIEANKILLTVGRKPNSDQMNLQGIGIKLNSQGFIETNQQRRTQIPNIFAIGDIAGQPMLAHKASYEGVMVAEVISGKNRAYDAKTVPAVIFTDPEIASAGWTEEQCKLNGYHELKVGKFPFAANGRAVALMETSGFVKVVADAKTHIILGIHIVGPEASNLISEAALAIEMSTRLEDLALTIHPHPTLGETLMEASEAALGHAIHIINQPLTKRPRANA